MAAAADTRSHLGTSLGVYLHAAGPLPPDEWRPIARQVAARMRAAHEQGRRAGDLTPGTLLLLKDGRSWEVQLLDFGLGARNTSADDLRDFARTCYCALLGTPEPDASARTTLPGPWRVLLERCTAAAPDDRLPDFVAVLDRLSLIQARRPRPRRIRPSRTAGSLLSLTAAGTAGGAVGEVILARSARPIDSMSLLMATATGSAISAAVLFAALAAVGFVVFGDVVGEIEPREATRRYRGRGGRLVALVAEMVAGALWGVGCGVAVGVAAAGLYTLFGESVAACGVLPVGTLGSLVVGGLMLLATLITARPRRGTVGRGS